jgi:hypothetical protein
MPLHTKAFPPLLLLLLLVEVTRASIVSPHKALPEGWMLVGCRDVSPPICTPNLQAVLLADTYTLRADLIRGEHVQPDGTVSCSIACTLDFTCVAYNVTGASCVHYSNSSSGDSPGVSVNANYKLVSHHIPYSLNIPFHFPTVVSGTWPRTLVIAGNNIMLDGIRYENETLPDITLHNNLQTRVSIPAAPSTPDLTLGSTYVTAVPGILFLPILLTDLEPPLVDSHSHALFSVSGIVGSVLLLCCASYALIHVWRSSRKKKQS